MEQLAEIIKYEGDNTTFVWKHPCEDFNSLSQLIVHESQEALFMMNGQALDLFGPGRYTLETQNLPILGKTMNRATGGKTPFHCEVYFINKTVQMGIKWGTDSRVRFIEPNHGIPLEIGASGELNLAVSDSRKLLVKLVGTMNGIAWEKRGLGFTKSLEDSFWALISTAVKTHLASSIKSENINILEIDEHLEKLSEILRKNITPGFEEYGLTIPQFYINNVILPEDNKRFNELRDLHALSFDIKMKEVQRTKALEDETTETERLKRATERELIQAQTDAQKAKLKGFAEAEIMAAQGYSKKDEFQRDVQIAYAEGIGNMGANGGGSGIVGDFVSAGVGIAAAGAMGSQMGEMFKGFNNAPSQNNSIPQGQTQQEQPVTPPSSAKELTCPKCGKAVPSNAKFCLECGTKIELLAENEMICPACGKKTPKGKFCIECGASLVHKCPKCDAEVPNGAKFCLNCGEQL